MNTRCKGCHQDIAAEWRSSLHHLAHTDPVYQSQFAREPFPFCTGCHAPEAIPTAPVPEPLSRLGVGCVTCHVAGDQLLAAPTPIRGPARDGEPHAVTRTAAFAGPQACAACHEFAFPEARRGADPLLMQSTMKEHAASAHADRPCASCHMPLVPDGRGEHRSHAFAASRDEAFVRSAVVIDEAPFVHNTLTITLRPGAVGHAFPTGDMLRRLALVIDVLDRDGAPVEHEERHLARHFGFAREPDTPPRRVLRKDDRVGAGPTPIVLTYTPRVRPEGGRLRYTLRYERVSDPTGGESGRALVDGAVLLAEGTLPLTTPPSATPPPAAPR